MDPAFRVYFHMAIFRFQLDVSDVFDLVSDVSMGVSPSVFILNPQSTVVRWSVAVRHMLVSPRSESASIVMAEVDDRMENMDYLVI